MKVAKRLTSSSGGGNATGGITAENYVAKAAAFIAGRETGFVIRSLEGFDGSFASSQPATEPQWVAWMNWFFDKGIKSDYARKRGMTMVPCEWPEDFDLECQSSDRYASLPEPKPLASPADRLKVLAGLQRMSREMAALRPETRDHAARRKTLLELVEEYRATPVTLSPAASRSLGILPSQQAAE